MSKPNFQRGTEGIEDAMKRGSGNFRRTEMFSLEDGEECWIRFLTDLTPGGVISVFQHFNAPTRTAPADYKGDSWPSHMGAVCRRDEAFAGMYDDCYICDVLMPSDKKVKRSKRQWVLGVLREEVREDGLLIGYRDKRRTITIAAKDGRPEQEIEEPAVVYVNMGAKNFFNPLRGFFGKYGTVLDRDYWIKREGEGLETTYSIIPEDPIRTDEGVYTAADPEVLKKYEGLADLEEEIVRRSSDEHYGRFFDTRLPQSSTSGGGESGAAPVAQQTKPETDTSAARLAQLAERVKGHGEATPEAVPSGAPRAL